MYYKDKKYYLAIKDYRNGDNASVISILKMLSKKDYLKYEEDINVFLTEVQSIAKKNGDNVVISYTKAVGNKISFKDGNSNGNTSVYENALETETECKILMKKALENDEFEVAITNILEFIRNKQNFHTAFAILKLIHGINYKNEIFTKKEIIMIFIEKMYKIIVNEVRPQKRGMLIKKYTSEWVRFSSSDFIAYHKIVKLYTKEYSINKINGIYNEYNRRLYKLKKENEKRENQRRKKNQKCENQRKKENIIAKLNEKAYPHRIEIKTNLHSFVFELIDIKYDRLGYDIFFNDGTFDRRSRGEFKLTLYIGKKKYEVDDSKMWNGTSYTFDKNKIYIPRKKISKILIVGESFDDYYRVYEKYTEKLKLVTYNFDGRYYVNIVNSKKVLEKPISYEQKEEQKKGIRKIFICFFIFVICIILFIILYV